MVAAAFLLNACDDATTPAAPPSAQEEQKAIEDRLDAWLGKWDGPEGTYLKLEKSGEGYAVMIKDLYKEERYLGVADGARIRFHRGDRQEYIRLGGGNESGMKWLQDKPYCLIVKKGEAYCRDKM